MFGGAVESTEAAPVVAANTENSLLRKLVGDWGAPGRKK